MSLGLEKTAAHSGALGNMGELWEKEFRLIAEKFPVWVSYIDAQERFRYVNATCAAWLARPKTSILEATVEEISPAGYGKLKPHIEDALAGKEIGFASDVVFPDGQRRHVSVRLLPHWDELGHVDGFYAFAAPAALEGSASHRTGGHAPMRPATGATALDFGSLLTPVTGFVDIAAAAMPRAGLIHETPAKVLEAMYGDVTPVSHRLSWQRREPGRPDAPAGRTLNDEIASGQFLSVRALEDAKGQVSALRVMRDSVADVFLEGPVTGVDPMTRTITLLGITIAVADDAEIRDAGGGVIESAAFFAQVQPGDTARIGLAQPTLSIAGGGELALGA